MFFPVQNVPLKSKQLFATWTYRYPGPATQLHPQHKRLLSQKQRAFPRFAPRPAGSSLGQRNFVYLHANVCFAYLKESRWLGSVLEPDDGQGEGVDHQAADDPAAEWTSLPWRLLLPGRTEASTFMSTGSKMLMVWMSSTSGTVVGVLPTDGGKDGGGGAGHPGQEGAAQAHHTLHHKNRLLHTRFSSSQFAWCTRIPKGFLCCEVNHSLVDLPSLCYRQNENIQTKKKK